MSPRLARPSLAAALLVCALGCLALAAASSSRAARTRSPSVPQPSITSLTVSPAILPASGGLVKLVTRVSGARTCLFTTTSPAVLGLPLSAPCRGGHASARPTIVSGLAASGTFCVTANAPGAATARRCVSAAVSTDGATGQSGTSASTSASGPTGPSGPPGSARSWHQIFDGGFAGGVLNTSQWSVGWDGHGITGPVDPVKELECYDPSHVSLSGGVLGLLVTATPETCRSGSSSLQEGYASGMINTQGKFNFTYGYVEVRAWLPGTTSIADWPQIWAVGRNWPAGGELDLIEGLRDGACFHFHNPAGAEGGCAPGDYAGGWHTFAADWEPGIVTWYYDGVAVGSVTSGVTSSPMFLLVNLAVDHTYGGPIATPATMKVSYVRIWQH